MWNKKRREYFILAKPFSLSRMCQNQNGRLSRTFTTSKEIKGTNADFFPANLARAGVPIKEVQTAILSSDNYVIEDSTQKDSPFDVIDSTSSDNLAVSSQSAEN